MCHASGLVSLSSLLIGTKRINCTVSCRLFLIIKDRIHIFCYLKFSNRLYYTTWGKKKMVTLLDKLRMCNEDGTPIPPWASAIQPYEPLKFAIQTESPSGHTDRASTIQTEPPPYINEPHSYSKRASTIQHSFKKLFLCVTKFFLNFFSR